MIHAIQTGSVRIKTAQVEGRGKGVGRRLAIFRDSEWTPWLPTFAWAIEHPTGVIVVDSGQGRHLLEHGSSWHPYTRWEVDFQVEPEQEIGPQLRALGINKSDVQTVVLTHLHMDHDGGLHHFEGANILVPREEIKVASGWAGRLRGYLSQRWPTWFDPIPLDLSSESLGTLTGTKRLSPEGDVIVVATPGHTASHVSVVVWEGDTAMFLAGDASYTQELMIAGVVDGVSQDEAVGRSTLHAIREFSARQPTIYLPTHDPNSASRLQHRSLVPSDSSTVCITFNGD